MLNRFTIFILTGVLLLGAGILGFSAPLPAGLGKAVKASSGDRNFEVAVRPELNTADAWLPRLQKNVRSINRGAECHRIGEQARAEATVLHSQGKNEEAIEQLELAVMMYFLADEKEMVRAVILEASDRYEDIGDMEAAEEMRRALSDADELPGEPEEPGK